MEDTNDKRDTEIVKMPQTDKEAREMLKHVEHLLNNLTISSPNMAGNSKLGFSFNP